MLLITDRNCNAIWPQSDSFTDASGSATNSDEIHLLNHGDELQESLVDTTSESSGHHPDQIEVIESNDDDLQSVERLYDDLGQFIDATISAAEITAKLKEMSDAQTLHLLQKHYRPDSRYAFPAVFVNGCNRSFKYSWIEKYPWIVYSARLDGVFCIYCALFRKDRSSRGSIVNLPFTKWTRCSHVFKDHATSKPHINAITDSEIFQEHLLHTDRVVPVLLEKKMEMIRENREILSCIVEAIVFCGRQCIALRGEAEADDQSGNPGNFLAILKLMSRDNEVLNHHLKDARQKNGKYISPDIQNQLINIIGEDILQATLIDEVRQAKFYSIMADEITTHNKEQLSICLRFVDNENNVRDCLGICLCDQNYWRSLGMYTVNNIKKRRPTCRKPKRTRL
ncbi:uncharacterized protein LOC121385929 [Gigantopelta aegis]|uniref:uncharacterized protein LOC121385929 n=1 Tax=Gigantopelta aegis TaxID=1735272 RepID=UPI001B88DF72|nr:uncharacterized protein LOC121385929 [Gigantopelta aegis]